MTKTEIYNFLKNKKYFNELNFSERKNNFKFANKDLKKKVYWFTIDLDIRIEKYYHFLLIDSKSNKAIYLKIPSKHFSKR